MKKFRSYPVRFCFKLVGVTIAGVICAFAIFNICSFIPNKQDVWWGSFKKTVIAVIAILVLTCVITTFFMRERVYYINYNKKILKKGQKIIHYEHATSIKITKTITHRMFGLVTIKVKTPHGNIVLKDVPEKIENYLRGKY